MSLEDTLPSRRKLAVSIVAGIPAIAVAIGGYAIAGSGSASDANAGTVTGTAGKVVPFDRGHPSPAKQVRPASSRGPSRSGAVAPAADRP
jgi:type IV secretory pathway TrbL component